MLGVISFFLFGIHDYIKTITGKQYKNITDFTLEYEAKEEIQQARDNLRKSKEQAKIIAPGNGSSLPVAITFDGLTDRMMVQRVLDLLNKHDVKATFFVDGLHSAEDPQILLNIRKAGFPIENYTLSGMANIQKLTTEQLLKEFCVTARIIKVYTDRGPGLLRCNDSRYTPELLEVARACGFESVVQNDLFLDIDEISKSGSANNFVKKNVLEGSIISVKLLPYPETVVADPPSMETTMFSQQPGLKELPELITEEKHKVVAAVEALIIALKDNGHTIDYVDSWPRNGRPAAPEPKVVPDKKSEQPKTPYNIQY